MAAPPLDGSAPGSFFDPVAPPAYQQGRQGEGGQRPQNRTQAGGLVVSIAGQFKDRLHGRLLSLAQLGQLPGKADGLDPQPAPAADPAVGEVSLDGFSLFVLHLFLDVVHGHGLAVLLAQFMVDGGGIGVFFHGNLLVLVLSAVLQWRKKGDEKSG